MIRRSLWLLVPSIALGPAGRSQAQDEPSPPAARTPTMDWLDKTCRQARHAEHSDWLGSHQQPVCNQPPKTPP